MEPKDQKDIFDNPSFQAQAPIKGTPALKVVQGGKPADEPAPTLEETLAEMEADRAAHDEDRVPYYARRNEEGHYTYKGELTGFQTKLLKSVTTHLAYAPGQFLIPWAGKQSTLECCSYLVRAGVPTEDPDILEFCAGVLGDRISLETAYECILSWKVRMLASERYRDHKGRIGSLGHHYVYSRAIGKIAPDITNDKQETLDWLWQQAISLRLFEKKSDPNFEPSERQIEELCHSAWAYVLSSAEWIDLAKPRWSMIGQEAMVVHVGATPDDPWFEDTLMRRLGLTLKELNALPEELYELALWRVASEYAGTVDEHFELIREDCGIPWESEWPDKEVSLWSDIKHSNAIDHKSVQAQVSAYAASDRIVLVQTGQEFELPKANFIASRHVGPHASALGIKDEFGTLESKTKQVGAKLYTYPRSKSPLQGFLGLCGWVRYVDNVPRAHQQNARRSGPKEERLPKTAVRSCPF